jgi:hypothetical protein
MAQWRTKYGKVVLELNSTDCVAKLEKAIQKFPKNVNESFIYSDIRGGTLLHWAVIRNRLECTKFLLSKNADVTALFDDRTMNEYYKKTPFQIAYINGNEEIMKLFPKEWAQIEEEFRKSKSTDATATVNTSEPRRDNNTSEPRRDNVTDRKDTQPESRQPVTIGRNDNTGESAPERTRIGETITMEIKSREPTNNTTAESNVVQASEMKKSKKSTDKKKKENKETQKT